MPITVVQLPSNSTLPDQYEWAEDGEWNKWEDEGTPDIHGSNGGTQPPPTTVIGVGSQTFKVECWGLKPNTVHKAFLIDKNVSDDCVPRKAIYQKGERLISAADGTLEFDYQFKPKNSPFKTKEVDGNKTIAIIPAGKKAFKVISNDGKSHAQSFIKAKKPTDS